MTGRLRQQGPRYLLVAVFCTSLHNAIMIGLDRAGIVHGISLLVSFAVLLPTGFLLLAAFTFAAERSWRAFRRYTTAMMAGVPVTFVTIWLIQDVIGLPMLIAAPLSTLTTLIWNFLVSGWALKPPGRESFAAGAAK